MLSIFFVYYSASSKNTDASIKCLAGGSANSINKTKTLPIGHVFLVNKQVCRLAKIAISTASHKLVFAIKTISRKQLGCQECHKVLKLVQVKKSTGCWVLSSRAIYGKNAANVLETVRKVYCMYVYCFNVVIQ